MKPHLTACAILGLAVALTTAASCRHCDNNPDDRTHVTIAQWGQEKYLIYLPLYVAMEEGFFAKRKLNVQIKFTGNDDQTFAAVIKGDAQFGVGDPVFAAIARQRGFPARVVATIVGGVAIWGVTNKATLPVVTRPDDLAGLRVGTFPEPSTNYTLMREIIQRAQLDLRGTRIVQAPIGAQLALLERGDADIAMELEPATSLAVTKGYRVVYSSPRFHGPFAFTGLTTTQSVISRRKDTVQAVVSALEESARFCHRNSETAARVARHLFPQLPAAVVEMAVRRMTNEATIPDHVEVLDEAWQAALRTRIAVGDLSGPQATGVTVDNSFARNARHQSD